MKFGKQLWIIFNCPWIFPFGLLLFNDLTSDFSTLLEFVSPNKIIKSIFLFSIMNDPVWSVNLLVAIDVIATAGVVWWVVNYDKLYNK